MPDSAVASPRRFSRYWQALLAIALLLALVPVVMSRADAAVNGTSRTSGGWTTQAVANTGTPTPGQAITLDALVTSNSTRSGNVSLQVYSSTGRVHEQVWTSPFTAGSRRTFSSSWTVPTTPGTLYVKIQVFNPNWSTSQHWNDSLTVTVANAPTTTTTIAPTTTTTAPTTTTTTAPTTTTTVPTGGTGSFLATFDGAPTTPQPWKPADWDVTVHSRDNWTWNSLETMHAGHGTDCAAPPATHDVSAYADAVFLCKDHVMTSINAEGYGVIYLTPNQLVDFSGGETVIRWDVSTAKTSTRDWWDVWVSPYDEHLQLAGEDWYPDLQGPPKSGVHVKMADFDNGKTGFIGEVFRNHAGSALGGGGAGAYETWLTPDAARRDTFELRISAGHIKFGMPAYNRWWIDTNVSNLGFTQGVLQIGHHSYNPSKDDKVPGAHANTWHWDNVSISNAIPFSIIRANARTAAPTATFPTPAPAGSKLRFAAWGTAIQTSFDGGATWVNATRQPQFNASDHFSSYFTNIPAGTTSVRFRGSSGCCGIAASFRDISIWTR